MSSDLQLAQILMDHDHDASEGGDGPQEHTVREG